MPTMGLFETLYDPLMRPFAPWLLPLRRKTVSRARGRVLEIGAGTGANFPLYPRGVSLTACDPSESMLHQARKKIMRGPPDTRLVCAPGERLPFPDRSFDCVVATLVLCSVRNVEETLSEILRVLRPGGEFFALEHIRIDRPHWIGTLQDQLTPAWRRIAGNCHLNRNTIDEIRAVFPDPEVHVAAGGAVALVAARKPGNGEAAQEGRGRLTIASD